MPEQTEGRMRTLWRRMAEIYGPRFTTAYGEDAGSGAGETWAKGLIGLSGQQLAAGLEACIASSDPWPPTLPEFRARCLSIPTLQQVREDLRRNDQVRMAFTASVWARLDGWAFTRANQREADRMLREAFADAREAVMRGEPLPEPAPALKCEPQVFIPAAPHVVDQAMAEIMQSLGVTGRFLS